VIFDFKVEYLGCAPTTYFDIARFVAADRHGFIGQVRNRQQQAIKLFLDLLESGFGGFELVAQIGDFSHDRRDILTLGLGLTDALGGGIAGGLQFLHLDLQSLALVFQRGKSGGIQGEVAAGQACGDSVKVVTEQLDVDHGSFAVWFLNRGILHDGAVAGHRPGRLTGQDAREALRRRNTAPHGDWLRGIACCLKPHRGLRGRASGSLSCALSLTY